MTTEDKTPEITKEAQKPNEEQIKEWFLMRYGDKFVPTKEQMEWLQMLKEQVHSIHARR